MGEAENASIDEWLTLALFDSAIVSTIELDAVAVGKCTPVRMLV
jgi:hypothetical protein